MGVDYQVEQICLSHMHEKTSGVSTTLPLGGGEKKGKSLVSLNVTIVHHDARCGEVEARVCFQRVLTGCDNVLLEYILS